jgi:orotidine-5'-phosphate decarboxylase
MLLQAWHWSQSEFTQMTSMAHKQQQQQHLAAVKRSLQEQLPAAAAAAVLLAALTGRACGAVTAAAMRQWRHLRLAASC